jgi:hypothetical protein
LPRRAAYKNISFFKPAYFPEGCVKLYHLYGLAVASDFDCPELTEITPEQAAARNYATVQLIRATAPLTLPEGQQYAPWMRATRDACLYELGDIARMLVERPDRITVEMRPGAVESDMRAYLLGTGFGTLVHMRGLIPLHIAAIQTPEGVVAFTGPSGTGKSTKVAELHFKHGWPVICDDVAVLHPSDPAPLLHAGVNRIKLWQDAVERFGIDPSRLTRDIMRHDKYHLYAPEMFVSEPVALDELTLFDRTASEKEDLSGASSFAVLNAAVYRPEISMLFMSRARSFVDLVRLAEKIRVSQGSLPECDKRNVALHVKART